MTKVLYSAVGIPFAVKERSAIITAGPSTNLPIRVIMVSLSRLIVFRPAFERTIPM